MSHFPRYPKRTVHSLDGIWDAADLGSDVDLDAWSPTDLVCDQRLPVPGCFDTTPAFAGKRGSFAYRTVVQVAPGTEGLLTFGGGGLWLKVFVDGEVVGVCDQPYAPFQVRVPASPYPVRELIVLIDNRFDNMRSPFVAILSTCGRKTFPV